MVLPHVLVHTPGAFLDSPVQGVMNVLVLSLLFGLPFAVLQRRVDLSSAIIAHTLVDALRFTAFGLPW